MPIFEPVTSDWESVSGSDSDSEHSSDLDISRLYPNANEDEPPMAAIPSRPRLSRAQTKGLNFREGRDDQEANDQNRDGLLYPETEEQDSFGDEDDDDEKDPAPRVCY